MERWPCAQHCTKTNILYNRLLSFFVGIPKVKAGCFVEEKGEFFHRQGAFLFFTPVIQVTEYIPCLEGIRERFNFISSKNEGILPTAFFK
jgi:hypothetical protein